MGYMIEEIILPRFEGDEVEVARYEFTKPGPAVTWYNETLELWAAAQHNACPVEVRLMAEVADRPGEFTVMHSQEFAPNV